MKKTFGLALALVVPLQVTAAEAPMVGGVSVEEIGFEQILVEGVEGELPFYVAQSASLAHFGLMPVDCGASSCVLLAPVGSEPFILADIQADIVGSVCGEMLSLFSGATPALKPSAISACLPKAKPSSDASGFDYITETTKVSAKTRDRQVEVLVTSLAGDSILAFVHEEIEE